MREEMINQLVRGEMVGAESEEQRMRGRESDEIEDDHDIVVAA
jgi:hypothetical protein